MCSPQEVIGGNGLTAGTAKRWKERTKEKRDRRKYEMSGKKSKSGKKKSN